MVKFGIQRTPHVQSDVKLLAYTAHEHSLGCSRPQHLPAVLCWQRHQRAQKGCLQQQLLRDSVLLLCEYGPKQGMLL